MQQAKRLMGSLLCKGVNHVNRNNNMPAHLLAKYGCKVDDLILWLGDAPDYVNQAIMADISSD